MSDDWHEHAQIWEQDEHAQAFAELSLASLLEQIDLQQTAWKGRRVLDFGCGTGLLTEKLAPLVGQIVALDISAAMLAVLAAKKLANVEIHCADINDDAVRAAADWFTQFDMIVASAVCSDLSNYPRTVALLAQALKPAGLFVQWDWLVQEQEADDEDGLSRDAVVSALTGAGLTLLSAAPVFDVEFGADEVPVLMGLAFKPG